MPLELTVLCLEKPGSEDQNVIKLAKFLGLSCNVICLQVGKDDLNTVTRYLKDSDLCMAVSNKTLSIVFQRTKSVDELRNLLFEAVSFLLIYDLQPDESSAFVLPLITKNTINSISSFDSNKHEYSVSQNYKEITGVLSGLTVVPINNVIDYKFELSNKSKEKSIDKIISIDKEAFFISLEDQGCKIFLVATSKLLNIDTYLEKTDSLRNYFSQFIPTMMFLKYVFKESCWHNDNLYANFIIDDPLLKRNYGFLNYEKLLDSMNEYNFATTIAFIPWNYKRTNKKIAKLFSNENDKLSICIHGCDHTQKEFGSLKSNELDFKLKLSTKRMDYHKEMTGISYEKVIVFPQGYFSLPAMRMLKNKNYLAAVNSTAYSVDSSSMKISDLLDTTIMSFENFPLFTRRYPSNDIVDFAIDAFLGKPLLIVEHHDYFKHGYEKIGKFIQQVNSISKNLQWRGLCEIVKTTYMERDGNSGEMHCKIFANIVFIKNKHSVNKKYFIQKKETQNIHIKTVLVDNKEVQYCINNALLMITFEMEPNQIVKVEILYEDVEIGNDYRINALDNIKVFIRRYLSEIRDNYKIKNKFVLKLAYKFKRFF